MWYLTATLILYYILDMMFPNGFKEYEAQRIYPQVLMALICCYCLFVSFKNRVYKSEAFFKPFKWILLMALMYIIYPLHNPQYESVFFENVLFFLKSYVAISFMFLIYRNLQIDEMKTMRCIYVIFAVQVIYAFNFLLRDFQLSAIQNEIEMFDSNAGFMMICCVPMALLLPQKRLRLYVYALLVVACIFSGQRSAALAAAVSFPFAYTYLRHSVKKIDYILFAALFIVVGIPVLQHAIDNIQMRNEWDADKGSMGSGRQNFWLQVLDGYIGGNLFQWIFGNGTSSVTFLLKKKYGMAIYSHNGWLDALYNYGLIGFIFYFKAILNLFKYNKYINKYCPNMKNIGLTLFVIFVVKCTTSHGNWDITVMPFSMVIAIALYQMNKTKSIRFQNEIVNNNSVSN